MVAALIGLVGVAAGAGIAVYGQGALERLRLRRETSAVIARYRDPLAASATDLHWSIYNILCNTFLWRYVHDDDNPRREVAINTTLFNFAQYFAWREILRQEILFLPLDSERETVEINSLMGKITACFSWSRPDFEESFRLWKAEQRAIGELMTVQANGLATCMGYARFLSERRGPLAQWLDVLEADLIEFSGIEKPAHKRLREAQHLLADLAERLDRQGTRKVNPLPRA